MPGMSDFLENEIMDHFAGVGSWTMPTAHYAALHTADPGETGSGTEVSGGGYARQLITFGAASGGIIANNSAESFPASGADFGTVSHHAIRSAVSAGNLYAYGAWSPAVSILDTDTFQIAVGAMQFRFPNAGAGKLTTYAMNKLLDHIFGVASFTMPTLRLGLFTVAPTIAGGGTEVSGNGYARQAPTFSAASGGATANTGAHTFTASGGNWGALVYWGLFDALTTGNLLAFGPLTDPRTVNDGDSYVVPIGDIDLSFA